MDTLKSVLAFDLACALLLAAMILGFLGLEHRLETDRIIREAAPRTPSVVLLEASGDGQRWAPACSSATAAPYYRVRVTAAAKKEAAQ